VTKILKRTIMISIGVTLAGCSTGQTPPLFFAQTHTFGVGIRGSAGEQGANLTLGYRDLDVALVPVAVTDASGRVMPLQGSAGNQTIGGTNALSVFGQFNADVAAVSPSANLGTFFTTGLAADKLADGYRAKMMK
jgi:hypothetical protein